MLTHSLPCDKTVFDVEMHTIARLVKDNPDAVFNQATAGSFPIKVIASGNYGVAFSLDNYPGLVLKVCRDKHDGYPEYIRAVARLGARRKRWMPEVLAHGGCESDVFWCVLPFYHDPAGTGPNWQCTDGDWYKAGGQLIEAACGIYNLSPTVEKRAIYSFETGEDTFKTFRRKDKGTKKVRRFMRQVREFLKPMKDAGGNVYMHAHNALKDGEQWVITDPIASWDMGDKESYRNAHS